MLVPPVATKLAVPTSPGGPDWDWWKEADILGSEPLTPRAKVALHAVAWTRSEALWAADADDGQMMVRSLLGSADSISVMGSADSEDSAQEADDCEDTVSYDIDRRHYNTV